MTAKLMIEHEIAAHALAVQADRRIRVLLAEVTQEALHILQQRLVVANRHPGAGAVAVSQQINGMNVQSATGKPASHLVEPPARKRAT